MLLNEEMDIERMIQGQGLQAFIHINGILPYLIDINTDLYIFSLSINMNGVFNSDFKKRKILFTTCQKWVENQKIPAIKSVLSFCPSTQLYTNRISKYKICIQIFENEIDYFMDNENFIDKVKVLYQSVLSFISAKYNQVKLGKDCINISMEDGGSPQILFFKKYSSTYKCEKFVAFSSFTVSNSIKHSDLDFSHALNEKDIIWLYYFNLSIYSFNRQDYLNSIIYCAISLESYLNYLIDLNSLSSEFNIYNSKLKEKERVPGFFTTCSFLKLHNILDNKVLNKIKSCYGELSIQRNDIIHGNILSIMIDSSISKKSIEKLDDIYSTVESDIVK